MTLASLKQQNYSVRKIASVLDRSACTIMRLHAIEATKAGMKATDLALAYGVHRRTVFRWLADFYKGGEQALKAKPIPGRPPKLAEPQMQSLSQAVTDQTPLQHGFEVGLWTLSILRELIRRQFGHTMSLSSVSRVMSLLGITVQKPLYRAWQQDPERVRKWETEEFPAIKKQARAQDATVFFADEAGIRSDYHTGTTWAPAGQTPVVGDSDLSTLLAQHALGGESQGRVPLYAARRHRHGSGLQDLPAAPDGGRNESGVRGGRWPPRSQVCLGATVHRESGRPDPVVLPCRRTRPSSTRTSRSGLMSSDASAANSRIQGRDETTGTGRLEPHPEDAKPGQIVLWA